MEYIIYILFFSLVWTFLLTLFVLTFLIKHLINKNLEIEVIKKAENFKEVINFVEKDNKHNKEVGKIINKEEIKNIKEDIKITSAKIEKEKEWYDGVWYNYNFNNK